MTAIKKLDEFTLAYIECALWCSMDESDENTGGNPLDENWTIEDIAQETLDAMRRDCEKFQADHYGKFLEENDPAQAGHDFWLTRNGHGAGFWDGDWPVYGDVLTKAAKDFGEFNLWLNTETETIESW